MSTNRKEILELLAQGKLSAEEAADLLSQPASETPASKAPAPEAPAPESPKVATAPEAPSPPQGDGGNGPTWFRVRVRNLETGKNRVSVNIPVRMLKFGLRIGKQFTSELNDLNWKDVDAMVTDMRSGMLVEVQDEESNEHVQVYLE